MVQHPLLIKDASSFIFIKESLFLFGITAAIVIVQIHSGYHIHIILGKLDIFSKILILILCFQFGALIRREIVALLKSFFHSRYLSPISLTIP